MRRSTQNNRSGAIMWRDREMPGFGHSRDLSCFRKATTPAQVKHDDAGHACFQKITKCPSASQSFGATDRCNAGFFITFENTETVHLDRVFVPESLEWREFTGNLHGGQELPHGMELDHDIHAITDSRPDFFKRLQCRFEIGLRDI